MRWISAISCIIILSLVFSYPHLCKSLPLLCQLSWRYWLCPFKPSELDSAQRLVQMWAKATNRVAVVFTATRPFAGSLHPFEATFSVECISVACDCLRQPITGLRVKLRGCDKKWGRNQKTAALLWVNNCVAHWETCRVPVSVQKREPAFYLQLLRFNGLDPHIMMCYWDTI